MGLGLAANPATWLLSAITANGSGTGQSNMPNGALDCRAAFWNYLQYECAGNSAIFNLQVSPDGAKWMTFGTHTATATETGSAQYSAYYPFVRGVASAIYSAAGGSANLSVFWHPLV